MTLVLQIAEDNSSSVSDSERSGEPNDDINRGVDVELRRPAIRWRSLTVDKLGRDVVKVSCMEPRRR